jgi:uncharacterized protein DUF1353
MRHSICVAIAITCAAALNTFDARAQQPITPVDFRPFSDGQHWIVKEPLTYIVGTSKESVTVPIGFVTDLASIPPILQSIIQQNGSYLLPAVVHDYLYWKQTCTQPQSDGILMLAMIEQKVSLFHRTSIFQAVQAAGSLAWDANTKERAARLLRIIPAMHLRIPANVTWASYRQQLMRDKVIEGPDTQIAQSFCARGGMPVDVALRP